jgi:asparagine synthase (glutamine-hydrolysing)
MIPGSAGGTFIAVVPGHESAVEAASLFLRASCVIRETNRRDPDSTLSNGWSFAASYPRLNGSGASIVADARTGSWIAALGTYFHRSGNNRPEHLLEQYLALGAEGLVNDLDGFFVIIGGHAASGEVVVMTDIVGSLHFYYRQFSSGVALSTSSLVLAQLDAVSLDASGCQEFLGTGVIYEDRTLYSEVKKLPPAAITRFANGRKVGHRQYWNLDALAPESLTATQATEALWENLTSTVATINRHFDSIVCDLTGGYDSRAIAAAFLHGQKTFSTVVSGPPNIGDVRVSRGLAEMLGLEHIHYPPVTNPITCNDLDAALGLTDGECDLLEYVAVARIHHDLSQRFQISINGSFGEVARGYWWELLLPHTGARSKLDSHKVAAQRYALSSASVLFQVKHQVDLVEHIKGVVDRAIAGFETYPNTFQMDVAYLRMRMQRWQGRIASSTNRIWPCFSPFMFRPVLEAMLQTRFAVRERSLLVRLMLAKYQPRLATYPLEHGNPALPATWKTIPKFWPLVPYYGGKVMQRLERKILRKQPAQAPSPRLQLWQTDEVRTLLQPATMKSVAVLDPAAVAAFLENSCQPGFSRDSEWRRLLTLEWALARTTVRDAG